jgi:uncharacterized protein (TIGR02391 family)
MKIENIDDIGLLLELEPEEYGYHLILTIKKWQGEGRFLPTDIARNISEAYSSSHSQEEAALAIMECFSYLEAQLLIIKDPKQGGNFGMYRLSRRARRIAEEKDFKDYITARLIPKDILHPSLRSVWGTLIRGKYDSTVFEAMKEVEVSVRKAAQLPNDLVGVDLIRKAFSSREHSRGLLTDANSLPAEQEAISNLLAGAIGYFKNPGSHRETNIDDPTTAMGVIMLANLILNIVDARKSANEIKE